MAIDRRGSNRTERMDRSEIVDRQERINRSETVDRTELTNHPETVDRQRTPVDAKLLTQEQAATLDPARQGVPVPDLHFDHFEPATAAHQADLARRRATGRAPEQWNGAMNTGYLHDARAHRAGRTTNCAECARCVQQTLDVRPRAASAIDPGGLPLEGRRSGGGEDIAYTEQWAGRRALDTTWEQIEARTAADGGSAIVFGWRLDDQGRAIRGHAFNAIHDDGATKLVDGQTGRVADWASSDYRETYPRLRAIHFPRHEATDDH